jgi:hypothetical protein
VSDLIRLWFGLSQTVSRRAYAISGAALMILKYLVEALLIFQFTGKVFTPLEFLSPLMSVRTQVFSSQPSDPLLVASVLWTIPFMWVGVSMSVRRAANAGFPRMFGLLFLAPFLNYVVMIVLAFAPTKASEAFVPEAATVVFDEVLKSALLGMILGIGIGLAMTGLSVYVLHDYSAALFLGTPFMIGVVSAYLHNRGHMRSTGSTTLVSMASVTFTGGAILLFALEGLLCVAMAAPVAFLLAFLGSLLGRVLASQVRTAHAGLALLALPFMAGTETLRPSSPVLEVLSAVDIDSPAERVWGNVIAFSGIPEPKEWYFRYGIAYPSGARIEGSGVGAVRYCDFSTGSFIEPITTWEAPTLLAFDVRAQPATMRELSFYRNVNAPHLTQSLRVRRGEFRLIPLTPHRVRLEGRTWYEIEMYPHAYWSLWSDALIHRIHERVLRHIKQLSEAPGPD